MLTEEQKEKYLTIAEVRMMNTKDKNSVIDTILSNLKYDVRKDV